MPACRSWSTSRLKIASRFAAGDEETALSSSEVRCLAHFIRESSPAPLTDTPFAKFSCVAISRAINPPALAPKLETVL
jgi:hypothetical protein